jgi:non-homologous end joining protein Ku
LNRRGSRIKNALKELLKKKQSSKKIEAPREREPSKVVNLMDALRRSVGIERGGGGERRKPAPGRKATTRDIGLRQYRA